MAMQFTPQQLTGFGGFKSRTLIGNWSEDIQLNEDVRKAQSAKKAAGGLLSQAILRKMQHHQTPTTLTPEHPDGYVRFGDKVMLQCADHDGFLSVDFDDSSKVIGKPNKIIATCAKADRPMLRNTWRIMRVESDDDYPYPPEESDILHYTEPFKIELTQEMCGGAQPMALYTELVTGTSWSKASHHQEVAVVENVTGKAVVWKAICIDYEYRVEMEGMPIKQNSAIIIHHTQTNQPLCSQKANRYITDFGPEIEVCCYADRGTGTKKKNLPELPPNHWGFISGPPQEGAVKKASDPRELTQQQSLHVINKVKAKLLQRGGNGFRGLTRVLNILDDNGNKKLDKYELDDGMQTYGIALHPTELDYVMRAFDTDGNGEISVREFMTALRGPISDRRLELVRLAFGCLDIDGSGVVTFPELKELYDVKKHPDVLAHTKTPEQVLQEFVQAWNKDGDSVITFDEFQSYYEDISAAIDSDDYFELMIRNAWHLSGGKGVAQNTSCRRVLVTHFDGSQTVEEIKNDIRIAADDIAAMRKNLEAQGIMEIRKIQLYS